MDTKIINSYIEILKEELVPALGCTEPIAIAYAAAKAREVLGCFPEKAVLECSGNIVKNVKSVAVPNTGGLTGIRASLLAGLVGGNPDNQLEVLSEMTPEHIITVKKLLDSNFSEVRLLSTDINLHLLLCLMAKDEYVTVEIKHTHINICKIEKNGQVVYQNDADNDNYLGTITDRSILTVEGIYSFANTVPLERVHDLIAQQIDYNICIAEEGLQGDYGINIGRTLLEIGHDEPVRTKIKAYTAAASEARMSGCGLPVVTNSGSGNQGIATSIPVIVYARERNLPEEKLYRGLLFSNLLTIHQKTLIGRLSAFCGAVSASCSSGAAITYLEGGTLEQINQTISNTLANVPGIVCDGAKPSCAAKIASCLDAAYMSHVLAMKGKHYQPGNGIVKADVEETIAAVGRIAFKGMRATDTEILKIMLESDTPKTEMVKDSLNFIP
ncbi:serine dehydratase subunit alpha family protein [Sporomusa sp.]|uniref:L-cysteine desulfidase family protein n=1 Tax=Sporomusa sp. TaxID=2078658 RepID=UPI002BB3D427|nr:L-serine ammonia-lyase, iron-sulfur-dependent, subunit alpha [Sporomusa sp.]HWR43946.1 L-serine ammonia-lyase, iron-sulfur-dependent, subunit alpha [Sporomusa sp.]